MRKHESFRAAIAAAFPELKRNPQTLAVFIDRGRIATRVSPDATTKTAGFEWRYTLNAVLLDFADDTNTLALAVLDWIRTAQPELLLNHTTGNEAFQFQVDVLDERKVDIEITIELNEAVDVALDGTPAYRTEPTLETGFDDVPPGTLLDAITIGGEALL
jgi:hypothetical protein